MNKLALVYNDDGTQAMAHVQLGRVRAGVEEWADMILATPVDTYVLTVAHPEICYYDTRVGERFGARSEQMFAVPFQWHMSRAHDELASEGTDLLRLVLERVHQRGRTFLASVRMSDAHHAYGPGYPLDPFFPQWTQDHPECRMKRPDGTLEVVLDYNEAAVRDHRLAIVREIVETYPVDGLELDFMRFCRHFPRPATGEQIALMTDFIHEVRRLLDHAARPRGATNRLILGVRVPQTLAECAPNGLDPATWATERLIDYVAPANFLWVDLNVPLDDYLRIVAGTDCRALFPIQPWSAAPWSEETRAYSVGFPVQLPEFRAQAANGYAAGAHGLYAFNLCCELPGRLPEIQEALRVMADRTAVYQGPRHYQFFPTDPGVCPTGANHRQALRFSPTSLGQAQTFRFQIGEDQREPGAGVGRLAWRIYNSVPSDRWSFRLNERPLDPQLVRAEFRPAGFSIRVGVELPSHMYFELELSAAPALRLRNVLEVVPTALETGFVAERCLEVLELWAD